MRGITTLVLRHKLIVALCWLAMAVAGFATLGSTVNRLTTDFKLPGQPGYVADQKIRDLYHNGGDTLPTLLAVTAPPGVGTGAVSLQAHQIFAAAAAAVPQTRLADATTTGDAKFTTADGRTTFAFLFSPKEKGFGSDTTTPKFKAAAAGATPAGWQTGFTGSEQLSAGNGSSKGTGVLAEVMIGSVGALAVLAYVFGSLLALLPLLMAGVAIPSTFLLINGLSRITSVSSLVEFLVALIGLGVAIDYSLLVVTRWREERDTAPTTTARSSARCSTRGARWCSPADGRGEPAGDARRSGPGAAEHGVRRILHPAGVDRCRGHAAAGAAGRGRVAAGPAALAAGDARQPALDGLGALRPAPARAPPSAGSGSSARLIVPLDASSSGEPAQLQGPERCGTRRAGRARPRRRLVRVV